MRKASIVYNPVARNAPTRERLQVAARSMTAFGWEVELRATECAGHATLLAREAAAGGANVVLASGGDGTVNEVVNGLAGSESALGLVRGGMGDVFGKEVGVPRSPEAALRLLVEGERRRFDLGVAFPMPSDLAGKRANGQIGKEDERYFLLMAGIGFDASVVRRLPSRPKRLLGSTSYALWGLAEAIQFRPRLTRVRLDEVERELDLYWALLGNTRSYGGIIDIASEAKADDGLLDAFVFSGRGVPWAASTALRLALRRQEGARGVSFRRVHEVEVSTPGIAVQADGEYFGETPMRFGVAPGAVEVLLPIGGGRRLLGAEQGAPRVPPG